MKNTKMTLAEARRRDRLIYDLATYETSGGLMLTEMSTAGIMNLHQQIAKKFNHFKKLVKSGEFTLEELEDDVVYRNAAIASPTVGRSIDDLDDFVKEFDKEEKDKLKPIAEVDPERGRDAFTNILTALLTGKSGFMDLPYSSLPEDHYDEDDDFDDFDEEEFE
jgi:uncharacterized protein YnzC (UPF0291/DUF896 family)